MRLSFWKYILRIWIYSSAFVVARSPPHGVGQSRGFYGVPGHRAGWWNATHAQWGAGLIVGCCSLVYIHMFTTTAIMTTGSYHHNLYTFNWCLQWTRHDAEFIIRHRTLTVLSLWEALLWFHGHPVWRYGCLTKKSLLISNSSAIRSSDFAESLAPKNNNSINRAGADSPSGSPKLTVWGRLVKKENTKYKTSFGAPSSCSCFSGTANSPLLQEPSHLEHTF